MQVIQSKVLYAPSMIQLVEDVNLFVKDRPADITMHESEFTEHSCWAVVHIMSSPHSNNNNQNNNQYKNMPDHTHTSTSPPYTGSNKASTRR